MALVAPAMWYFKNAGRLNPLRPSNIFYENGTTTEEVERFRNQDEIEAMGLTMLCTPGFGYHNTNDPRGL